MENLKNWGQEATPKEMDQVLDIMAMDEEIKAHVEGEKKLLGPLSEKDLSDLIETLDKQEGQDIKAEKKITPEIVAQNLARLNKALQLVVFVEDDAVFASKLEVLCGIMRKYKKTEDEIAQKSKTVTALRKLVKANDPRASLIQKLKN